MPPGVFVGFAPVPLIDRFASALPAEVRHAEHVGIELADRVRIRVRFDGEEVAAREREAPREVRVEVVRKRAVLQDLPHLLRLHRAGSARRIQHERGNRRGMGAAALVPKKFGNVSSSFAVSDVKNVVLAPSIAARSGF